MIKDKIILVFYIGLKNIFDDDRPDYMAEITQHMNCLKDDSTELLFIPLSSTNDSKIECINPRIINNEDEVKKIEELIEKYKNSLINE